MRLSRKERRTLALIEDRLAATVPDLAEALRDFGDARPPRLPDHPPARGRPWRVRWWTCHRVWLLLAGLGSAGLIIVALTVPGPTCTYQGLENHVATPRPAHGDTGSGPPVEIGCR